MDRSILKLGGKGEREITKDDQTLPKIKISEKVIYGCRLRRQAGSGKWYCPIESLVPSLPANPLVKASRRGRLLACRCLAHSGNNTGKK